MLYVNGPAQGNLEQATFKENMIKMMDYVGMEMGESGLSSNSVLQERERILMF